MGIKVNFAKPGEIEYMVTTRDDHKFVLRMVPFETTINGQPVTLYKVIYIGDVRYKQLEGQEIYIVLDRLLRDGCSYRALYGLETRLILRNCDHNDRCNRCEACNQCESHTWPCTAMGH